MAFYNSKRESIPRKQSLTAPAELANNDINTKLYKQVMLTDTIYLKPYEINRNVDATILSNLKRKLEGKCIEPGFVVPDSVNIISRTLGITNPANLDGNVIYNIRYSASVCNPAVGQIVICTVGSTDKSQVVCYIHDQPRKSPLEIYLSKHNHIGNVEFLTLKHGDIIKVKIAGSNFMTRDTQIVCIAEFINII